MHSLWSDDEASQYSGELGLRVYSSRLLGRESSLVLHGGGNTSVKIQERNLFGEQEDILYIKGSGWDLETIEPRGFSPVRLDHALRLAALPELADPEMVNQLTTHMLRASAPVPSVETILHACLPYKYVDHTHADSVVTISNTLDGPARIREIYGDLCVVVPYVMPGFGLAQLCAREFERSSSARTIGVVLLNHGILSFGGTARESYERMIGLVSRAEDYLRERGAWDISRSLSVDALVEPLAQAQLRRGISDAAGAPMLLKTCAYDFALGFARHPRVAQISQQGPATPDHVIRTKRVPMLGSDVGSYAETYRRYFSEQAASAKEPKQMLDPAPRVVLDPAFGLAVSGRTAREAGIVKDIYHHTMEIILRAEALGGFQALPAGDIFDVEYWDLEQAKLRKGGKPAMFAGEIALVTGAASGIGKALVESFLARGAAVAGLDINPEIESLHARSDYLGICCDITDERALLRARGNVALHFGGIDMLVLNAGIFAASRRIAELGADEWRRVMSVNLDANLVLMHECHPYLKLAPRGGRVVVIGSKNVPAPGPGAAAYSASKAALNQLARVAALEWGSDRIRVNTLHPNAVFDTGLWTDEVLAARARHYAMTVDEYKTNNVLRTEVTSHDVAELAAEMCGPLFAKTTGAQLPVDGGNERVI